MTKKHTTTGTRAPKKRAEKPVSEGIRRAAKRAGIAKVEAARLDAFYKAQEPLPERESDAEWAARMARVLDECLTEANHRWFLIRGHLERVVAREGGAL